MARKFFVGGNFKMNGTKGKIAEIISSFSGDNTIDPAVEVVLGVPGPFFDAGNKLIAEKGLATVKLSAQNLYPKKNGAYTGELGSEILNDFGIEWVILGHSERRTIFGENDQLIAEKVGFALSEGFKVIACIGETLAERQSNDTQKVVAKQLSAIKEKVTDWDKVVVAYEPVWAIGTGVTASPEQAQEVHEFLRTWLVDNVSPGVSQSTRIIYGGSVTGANCVELAKKGDIDGFLVGGASLKPEFVQIVNARR